MHCIFLIVQKPIHESDKKGINFRNYIKDCKFDRFTTFEKLQLFLPLRLRIWRIAVNI